MVIERRRSVVPSAGGSWGGGEGEAGGGRGGGGRGERGGGRGVRCLPPFPGAIPLACGRLAAWGVRRERPPMAAPARITVATAQFEDLVSHGLRSLIATDSHLELVAADVPVERFSATLARSAPQVAILNFGSL